MTSNPSTFSPAFHSTTYSPPQKDYAAAFGALQCQYGMGGLPTPPLPPKDSKKRKWYKRGDSRSSSTATLIPPATRSAATPPPALSPHVSPVETLSESELRLGKLMAEYGYGPASPAQFNRR